MDTPQSAEQASAAPAGTAAARTSHASVLWAELREYRQRRETWEKDLYRLLQARRDLEARHWQLVPQKAFLSLDRLFLSRYKYT